jgi:two-component system, cell cycle sensor histidine kinase and response regulator CckA
MGTNKCGRRAQLLESEKRFQALMEHSVGAIGLLDANGTLIYDSPAAPGLLGYETGELIGEDAFKLVHADDLPKVQALFMELVTTPGARLDNITFRLRHKNGQWSWMEATATNLLADPAVKAIVLNYHDITTRVHAEEALRESEERFRQVWEITSDAMALSDSEGIVLNANQAYLELYGYKAEQVIGQSFAIIFPPEQRERAVEKYKIIFAGDTIPAPIEFTVQRADGEERVIDARVAFLTKAGQRIALLSTIRDITQRVRAEEALSESHRHLEALLTEQRETHAKVVAQERLAAIGQLAAGIAHDFNNVMAVIILYSEMVEQSLSPSDNAIWQRLQARPAMQVTLSSKS